MADTFKKARELSRLAKQQQEEKERSSVPRIAPDSENDESFLVRGKRQFAETGEESGIRPPSKRILDDSDSERSQVSRFELAKLQAATKQAQEQAEMSRLERDKQKALLEAQSATHVKQVSLLESQVRMAQAASSKPPTPRADSSGVVSELRAELADKGRQLADAQAELDEVAASERKLRHLYDTTKEANAAMEANHNTLQRQLDELSQRVRLEQSDKLSGQECKILLEDAVRKVSSLEAQLAAEKAPEKLSQDTLNQLREREREVRQLTTENQRMRAKVRACETAEDELAELRSKETRNAKMREEFAHAESELLVLREREDAWISTLCPLLPPEQQQGEGGGEEQEGEEGGGRIRSRRGGGGPQAVLRLIESLQHDAQLQKAEYGQVVTANKQLELRLQTQLDKNVALESKLNLTEKALEQEQVNGERNRVELSRAIKDKEMYKGFLDSYEAEEKTLRHDDVRGERIEELEKSLSSALARATEKETALQVLELQHRQLQQHLQQADAELARMGEALGRGEFNPQNTKVLHMAANPAKKALEAKAQAQIEQLTKARDDFKAELDALKLQLLEGNSGAVVVHEPRVNSEDLVEKDREILKLKKTISDLEIAKERFYQVFREKVKEFRESCYMLTGYKIEMKQINNHNGFLLRSMYAEKEEDVLEFYDTGTKLQVMETDFCKRLDKNILMYLEKFNSIPAFLSEVTLDLFNKQTRM